MSLCYAATALLQLFGGETPATPKRVYYLTKSQKSKQGERHKFLIEVGGKLGYSADDTQRLFIDKGNPMVVCLLHFTRDDVELVGGLHHIKSTALPRSVEIMFGHAAPSVPRATTPAARRDRIEAAEVASVVAAPTDSDIAGQYQLALTAKDSVISKLRYAVCSAYCLL